MDLWQLHIFCKVIETKSFSKAGDAVRLSQPTVSSHIKDLEAYFDTRLVDRLTRTVLPTKAGALLYDYARRLLALRDKAESAMAEFNGKMKGNLAIGGSTIPGGYLLPKIIGRFAQCYPDVHVSLMVADTMDIIRKTLDGHIEFSVVGAKSREKQLRQEPVVNDEMSLVVPPNHKWARRRSVDLRSVLEEPFIIREIGSGTLLAIQHQMQQKGYSLDHLHIVAEMGSTEAVRQAIKSGAGISILSSLAVDDDVRGGLLHTLKIHGLELKRKFYLTTHKQRGLSPLSQAFIDFLKKEIQVERKP
jgi:DNA-binding transcriptional LysR family regulator